MPPQTTVVTESVDEPFFASENAEVADTVNAIRSRLYRAERASALNSEAENLTPDMVSMHDRLYRFDKKKIVAVSDADLRKLLGQLRADVVLDAFRLWQVGSRLEPGKEWADIDLVLSPRMELQVCDDSIEQALWHCRNFGLYGNDLCCLIDPCFRAAGPAVHAAPLQPETIVQTSKLFSPKLLKLVSERRILQFRRFGRFSIEYLRKAEETDYYAKLPRIDGSSYLRPAIEIL